MKNENLKNFLKINNLLNHLTIEWIHNIKQQNQKMIRLEEKHIKLPIKPIKPNTSVPKDKINLFEKVFWLKIFFRNHFE